jgi:hypothetical protein
MIFDEWQIAAACIFHARNLMPLNLAQRAGLRKCDMGNWVAREEMIGGVE